MNTSNEIAGAPAEELEFLFSTVLKGNILHCVISSQDPDLDYLVAVYMYSCSESKRKADLLYKEPSFTKDSEHSIDLTGKLDSNAGPVDLRVKVYARKGNLRVSRFGEKMFYMIPPETSPISRPELPEDMPDQLPFCRREKPYVDFCLVYGYRETEITALGYEGWYTHRFPSFRSGADVPCWMISSQPTTETATCTLSFSGFGRSDTMLLVGQEDAARLLDTRALRDSIGNFAMIYRDENGIYAGGDYFGNVKLYYYDGPDGKLVLSNRYHLLLLTMKALGIPCRIDHEHWMARLWRFNSPFAHLICRHMEIYGTYVMTPDRCIEIDQSGWRLVPTELDGVLQDPGEYHPESYMDLLSEAAEEITDNIRVVYRNPKVKRVTIDVTGGQDTRCVLAGWAHLPEAERLGKPTRMFTMPFDREEFSEDAAIGLEMGRRVGLDFTAWPSTVTRLDRRLAELRAISVCLMESEDYGDISYVVTGNMTEERSIEGAVRLMGECGEVCARVPHSREYIYANGGFSSVADLLDKSAKTGGYDVKLYSTVLRDAWRRTMEREMLLIPGKNANERWNTHFMYYWNGPHFSTHRGLQSREWAVPYGWGPLQSKTLFRLRQMTFHSFPEIKLQINLFEYLSPEAAEVRLGNPKDVIAREKLRESGNLLLNSYGKLPEMGPEKVLEMRAAFQEKQAVLEKHADPEEERKLDELDTHFLERKKRWFLYAFFSVVDEIGEELGSDRKKLEQWVWDWIIQKKNPRERFFVDRVLQMHYVKRLADA